MGRHGRWIGMVGAAVGLLTFGLVAQAWACNNPAIGSSAEVTGPVGPSQPVPFDFTGMDDTHLHSLDQWPGGRERPGERCDRLGQFCDAGPRKPGTGRQYRRQRHGSRCPVSSRPNVPDLRDDPIRATDCPGRFEPEPSDDTGVAATAFLEHFGAASASQRRAGSEPSGSG